MGFPKSEGAGEDHRGAFPRDFSPLSCCCKLAAKTHSCWEDGEPLEHESLPKFSSSASSLGSQSTDNHCCESFKARVSLVTPAASS